MEIQDILYINLHLKDGSEMEFTACLGDLMPEGELTSFTVCNISLLRGSAIVSDVIK